MLRIGMVAVICALTLLARTWLPRTFGPIGASPHLESMSTDDRRDLLVHALHHYFHANGHYPRSLLRLVPDQLPYVPSTGSRLARWDYMRQSDGQCTLIILVCNDELYGWERYDSYSLVLGKTTK